MNHLELYCSINTIFILPIYTIINCINRHKLVSKIKIIVVEIDL